MTIPPERGAEPARSGRVSGSGEAGGLPGLPVLPAGRYVLREFGPGDVPLVQEAAADPLIPLISSVPAGAGMEAATAFVERQRQLATLGVGYSFAVAEACRRSGARGHLDGRSRDGGREAAGGPAVGAAGLWLRDADRGRASVGYWVVARARRHGAAGSALGAISSWAIDTLRIPRLELYVEPWNVASVRTAEHAGYVREGLLRSYEVVGGERRDMYVYSLVAAPPT